MRRVVPEPLTVPGRIKALGLPDDPELAWKAGAAVREWWEGAGLAMRYDLRRKTSGSGSHQFAVYPDSARERIDELVRQVAFGMGIINPTQLGMFDGGTR